MDNIIQLIEGWVAAGSIPGAVIDISVGGHTRLQQAFGGYRLSSSEEKKALTLDSLFDIASLTKVTATLPAVMLLVSRGQMKLEDQVQRYFPEFRHPQVTVRHLLQHSSGLPPDLPKVDRLEARDVMREVFEQELIYETGTQVKYSDLGFILLGAAVERITGERLNEFVRREIHLPLGMDHTRFLPEAKDRYRIAPTEKYNGAFIHGEVHDEKSYQLGGVSGSAGLFATAADLARYGRSWLPANPGVLPEEWRRRCITEPFLGRGLGWEIWHGQESAPSCSNHWPHGSFGHTGFTGTSLWIEPVSGLVVVFLTNAVHYGRATPIRELRPLLHKSIYSSIHGVK
ncbi:serine hydrolase domain-containing protein [Paenibacillus sp. OAS669]|uniref:serine hydrolase domain-containing protein n=1 Tax=Paenibacillus sp. OAS669 TaxID=2663821 RepID=UPI00178908EF|nr:serine hydrolase domain-containing protein [Paenibacillus sp. OAS669]MBE1446306.1 CubicO group peptidase (beta-lactamase class C family) [Paenibacillus sp. OAS669]